MNFERLNAYRVMWVIVMFDLPTETKQDRKRYAKFRKQILDSGFLMFQFSMYIRHCSSKENAMTHVDRLKKILPVKGHIGIMWVTDKQFGQMKIYDGKALAKPIAAVQQLELF